MHLKAGWICAVLLMTGTVALQGCRNLPEGGNEAAEATAETLLTPAPDLPKPWVSPIDLSEKTELLDFEYVIPPDAAARAVVRGWMTTQAERLKTEARSEERRVGKGGVSTCRSRLSPEP